MNERIKELAEQAGITTNIDTDYFEKDMNKWVDYYSQKFAELIVKECIDLAITEEEKYSFSNSTPAKYFTAAISDFQGALAKHFGVEE